MQQRGRRGGSVGGGPPAAGTAERQPGRRGTLTGVRSEADDYADDFRGLAELAEAFLQLVSALSGGGEGLGPDRIVEVAARTMPRSRIVSLAIQEDGLLRTVAATSDVSAAVDRIRSEVGEGPALDAVETNDVVVSGQLADDPRWPRFGRRVTEETDVASAAVYRLYLGPRFRGVLTFYSDWPFAFDDLAVSTGAIFAAYASLALHHRFVLMGHLPYARVASVHTEIGVAVGILMTGAGLDTEAAYQRLHAASRELRSGLGATARRITEEDPTR